MLEEITPDRYAIAMLSPTRQATSPSHGFQIIPRELALRDTTVRLLQQDQQAETFFLQQLDLDNIKRQEHGRNFAGRRPYRPPQPATRLLF